MFHCFVLVSAAGAGGAIYQTHLVEVLVERSMARDELSSNPEFLPARCELLKLFEKVFVLLALLWSKSLLAVLSGGSVPGDLCLNFDHVADRGFDMGSWDVALLGFH